MKKWLHCESCDGKFNKQSQKVYILDIKEVKFSKDGVYEDTDNFRKVQLCEECMKNSMIGQVLKKDNREF